MDDSRPEAVARKNLQDRLLNSVKQVKKPSLFWIVGAEWAALYVTVLVVHCYSAIGAGLLWCKARDSHRK